MSSTDLYDGDLGSLRLSPPLARSTPSSSPHPDEPSKRRSSQYGTTSGIDGSGLADSEDRPMRPGHSKQPTLTRKISFPSDQLDPVQWERLRRWIVCFAVVEFDIDSGPNLDNVFPATRFPPAIKQNIAFSSLPEGADIPPPSALPDGGYSYHWRIPYPPESQLWRIDDKLGKGKEVERLPKVDEDAEGPGALHGFVWFVREKDAQLRRGFAQRSLVLISHIPHLVGLFSSLVSILGPLHFKHAQAGGTQGGMVETACHNIASWPDPVPGATLDLPFLGSVLTIALPLPSQAQFPPPATGSPLPYTHAPSPFLSQQAWQSSRSSPSSAAMQKRPSLPPVTGPPAVLPASLPLTPLCLLLFPSPTSTAPSSGLLSPTSASPSPASAKIGEVGFSKLLLLWELLVLGEPLLIWSGDAKVAAEVLEHLRCLIKPVPLAGDYRPYLHVHDLDFPSLCRPGVRPHLGLLIASTNPLLLTTCKHWPHILRLERPAALTPSTPTRSPSLSYSSASSPNPTTSPVNPRRAGSLDVPAGDEKGKEFGLKSERKRHVKKDDKVLKEIEDAWARGDYAACDAVIYRYFASLTEQFLAPLNRYFGTLWVGNEAFAQSAPLLSPGLAPLPSTQFTLPGFLSSLRTHGSSLQLRSSAPSFSQPGSTPVDRFYTRFISSSPHFRRWLNQRVKMTGGEVRRRYVRALGEVDVDVWARGRPVNEMDQLVDQFEREAGRLESPARSTRTAGSASPAASSPASSVTGLGLSAGSIAGADPRRPSLDTPAGRLRAQAERLKELRDERVKSRGLSDARK
ncbi:hypothetical protein NBRC10512_000305 [Rhodotorula toruloides]|uniref:RHTO0S11e00540g1_1 n=2 Tax=Rhodotorula toruloides TaxID=5286 RepID=A0A061BEU5_RHOTO|nr:DUF1630 family protein [Rhodotorula toruloides NP11]EMS19983.1 DUF1630 family protein [Rhodotorula toruloides NP11]CDR45468.1 RHTO0S11e00540g1_1 [Rhodotorula toruloides]